MEYLIIPLTIIALIGMGYIIIQGIILKEKEREENINETDDYRDEELNSVFDDYGENKFDF